MQSLKSIPALSAGNQLEPQRAVPAMLQSVYENLTQLEQNMDILRDRMRPVLEATLESGAQDEEAIKSGARNVPHAEQLEGIATRISYLNARTLDAINRLHV
ncbi:MAG TPA: hypothetical protein VF534_01645 [Paraburkholderia sp.]